jgi:hypothetical protein
MWFLGGYTARNPVIAQSAGQRDTGNGFADFLLGYPNQAGSRALQFRSVPLSVARLRYHEYSLYMQEDFRVHSQLTLNLGLRWEYRPPMRDKTGGGNIFDFDYPGGRRLYRDRAYTDLFNNPIIAACCAEDSLVSPNYRDFAPRVGVAWRPLAGNNRFVVRAGYGISYDLLHTYYGAAALLENIPIVSPTLPVPTGAEIQPPLDIRNLFPAAYSVAEQKFPPPYCQAPSQSIVDPITGVASVVSDFCPGGGGLANNLTPYTQQWGLNVQYELPANLLVEVGYQGSQGIRLPIMWAFNQARLPEEAGNSNNSFLFRSQCPPGTFPNRCSPVQERVSYTNFSASSSIIANRMQSNYHGLVLKADKRFSRGLQVLASFTWSRAIDQASEIQDVSGGSAAAQYAHRLDLERGAASFDQTRRFHASWLYELPFGKGQLWLNRAGITNRFLGGWQVNGILKLADGTPFTVGCNCGDRSQVGNTAGTSNRMNVIKDPLPPGFQQTYERWFDTSAFVTPALGTLGNSGRNTLRTPGQRATDLSVFKNNYISERTNIQFRAEFTNLFSGHFYSPVFPSLNATASDFGSLLPVGGDHGNLFNPRIIQFALRVVF